MTYLHSSFFAMICPNCVLNCVRKYATVESGAEYQDGGVVPKQLRGKSALNP